MTKDLKNIDVIVKYFYPVAAGIETNILETYSVLAKKGIKVRIHTSKDILTQKNVLKQKDKLRGLFIIRKPFKMFGFWPGINWKKTDAVCLHNFDIFPHFFILLYCLYLKIIGRKNFALILTPHGGFNPEWSIFSSTAAIVKKLYHFTIGTILINLVVDGMRAVSEWEKMEIVSKGVLTSKVVTIDNGIEDEAYLEVEKRVTPEFKSKVSGFGKYMIQIGRIYSIKNYETTITALSKLPQDLNYVIAGPVGSDEYFDKLKVLCNKLGIEDRVFFVGVVRGVDKYYLIKKAQLMVHMAKWESYCNVVHEGLSQGLVCIVANNTALPYLIKNGVNGFCVNTFDVKTLVKRIKFVMDNKESDKIKLMEKTNRQFGLENSWRSVSAKMESFYIQSLDKVRSVNVIEKARFKEAKA